MSFQAKRELLVQVAGRYRDATGRQKSRILDEFVAVTGYAPVFEQAQARSRHFAGQVTFDGKQFRADIGWREALRRSGAAASS